MLLLMTLSGYGCKTNETDSSSDIPTEIVTELTEESVINSVATETTEVTTLISDTEETRQSETSFNETSTEVTTGTSRETSASTSRTTETSSTTVRETTTEATSRETEYIPDSSHYIAIATRIASSYGCTVINSSNWDFYRNPIHLDSTLSDSTFERYVNEIMSELVANGNGYRVSFNVWVNDERTSGNQTHGPGFYLYIG